MNNAISSAIGPSLHRRHLLIGATAMVAGIHAVEAAAQQTGVGQRAPGPRPGPEGKAMRPLSQRTIGYMLAHEQFAVPELQEIGAAAALAGFGLLATSDHLQPWQANEGHSGQAWVTMGALGARAQSTWIGPTVTCPTLRYNPAVVAEAFASLSQLYPGRIFLGVGSGEALNEQAATGHWPAWKERWDRLIEAIGIIRDLWTGHPVNHKGAHYTVNAKLYDPPREPIPLLTAANGRKSMRLAGQYGDGLITDPETWKQHKSEWEAGARAANKDPKAMPVLVEQFVFVGDNGEIGNVAELWRFLPKAFKTYFNIRDPAEIQRRADAEVPVDKLVESWAVGTDPAVHAAKINELFESGATIVNIHSGQPEQRKVVEFFGERVLPKFTY